MFSSMRDGVVAAAVLIGVFGVGSVANGAVFTITSTGQSTIELADGTGEDGVGDGTANPGQTNNRVGSFSGTNNRNVASTFDLPTLPAGEIITGATLTYRLVGFSGTPTFNVDLYGLARTSSTGAFA